MRGEFGGGFVSRFKTRARNGNSKKEKVIGEKLEEKGALGEFGCELKVFGRRE